MQWLKVAKINQDHYEALKFINTYIVSNFWIFKFEKKNIYFDNFKKGLYRFEAL